MTPYDIFRQWESDMCYIPPEDNELRLVKTLRAIKKCDEIVQAGPNTEGATEAIEVRMKLRNYEYYIRSRES